MVVDYSLIVPTYCGSQKLPILLNSLCRQSVSKERFEVILIDDGNPSSERVKLVRVIRRYPELQIRLLALSKNFGPAVARNLGIENSSGKVIFFTDDDTELPALWMETHLRIYQEHPEISAIGGGYAATLSEQRRNPYSLLLEIRYLLLRSPFLFECIDSDSFKERRQASSAFGAANTANFSVKRHVTAKVKFDTHFFAPGFEDTYFSQQIQNAGFLIYAIPYSVTHHKPLNLLKFIKLSLNRGFGLYIFNSLTEGESNSLYNIQRLYQLRHRRSVRYIQQLAFFSPIVRKNEKKLMFLSYLYLFFMTQLVFYYKWKYGQKRRLPL